MSEFTNTIPNDSVESNLSDTPMGENITDASVGVNPAIEANPTEADTVDASVDTNASAPVKPKNSGKTGKEGRSINRIIVGVILIVMAIALAVFVVPNVGQTNETYGVIKVIDNIPQGIKLSNDNMGKYFSYTTTTDKNIASSVITGENSEVFASINGKYITRDIYATGSRFLCREDLADAQTVTNDKVPEGKELVGMLIPSIYGDVGFMPRPGDIIRFYGLKSLDQNGIPNFSVGSNGVLNASYDAFAEVYELLQYVEIYRVLDGAGIDTSISGATPTNMVIICTTEQVEQLVQAQNKNSVYLSLMSSGDDTRAASMLREQERIIERYKFRQEMVDGIERKPVLVPIEAMSQSLKDTISAYRENWYVQLKVLVTEETDVFSADGTITKVEATTIKDTGDILGCVQISGIYVSSKVVTDVYSGEVASAKPENVALGLMLSEEQSEALSALLKEGKVVIISLNCSPEELAERQEMTDAANRELIIDKLIAKQEEEKKAEEEASEAESSEAETSESEANQ